MQSIELTPFEAAALEAGHLTQIRRDIEPQPINSSNGNYMWLGCMWWDSTELIVERCPYSQHHDKIRLESPHLRTQWEATIRTVRVEQTGNTDPNRWQWIIDFTDVVQDTRRINQTADEIIADLESRGLGWSLDHTGRVIEARIWMWPDVVGRYRPHSMEPLADLLMGAYRTVNLKAYPVLSRTPPPAA